MNLTIPGLRVRPALTLSEYRKVLELRARGYRCFSREWQSSDALDFSRGAAILVAENDSGKIVGTMRIIDGTLGPIELDHLLNLDKIGELENRSFLEASRLTVSHGQHRLAAKLLLCKASWKFAENRQLRHLITSSTKIHEKDYVGLMFSFVHDASYQHPDIRSEIHRVMYFDVPTARQRYDAASHAWIDYFWNTEHDISFPDLQPTYSTFQENASIESRTADKLHCFSIEPSSRGRIQSGQLT